MKSNSPHHAPDPITVYVDPDLKDIVPGFLANRRRDVAEIDHALQNGDFETARVLGHRMKGDGGGYGFDTISDIGAALERAAARHDRPALGRHLAELTDFISRVDVVYRK